jgi:GNAT superfamily N-acetyltransferase
MPACADLLAMALMTVGSMRGGTALVGNATASELLARWTDATARTGEVSTRARATLYVGAIDDVVVGLAAATVAVRAHATEPSGRIECCFVEEGARGVGVGSTLMASLVAWCTQSGCHDVDALALPGDRLSKQRMEAAGFTARLLVLNRRLN